MPIPEYDKLDAVVLAQIVEDHGVLLASDKSVDFNVFVDEVFQETAPTYGDWCFLAALAMLAASRARTARPPTEETGPPDVPSVPPEPSKYDKAKDFLSNLLRPRGNPSSAVIG